jgi:flavodoxin
MKTAIVYYSHHHCNTKKLLDAIALQNEVTLIDATSTNKVDLSEYDRIGFASGIYYTNFAKQVISYARDYLPEGKEVFYVYTSGAKDGDFLKGIRQVVNEKNSIELGEYHCRGFDTFGPFKLVGGIAKGHPTSQEIEGAVAFYRNL